MHCFRDVSSLLVSLLLFLLFFLVAGCGDVVSGSFLCSFVLHGVLGCMQLLLCMCCCCLGFCIGFCVASVELDLLALLLL